MLIYIKLTYIIIDNLNIKLLLHHSLFFCYVHFMSLTPCLNNKPRPSPVILPATPTFGCTTEKWISSPRCPSNALTMAARGLGTVLFKCSSNSSYSSLLHPPTACMRVRASMRSGSMMGFVKIVSFIWSSTSISKSPFIFKRKAGAKIPKTGSTEGSNSPCSIVLIKTSEIFLHTFTLTSRESPDRRSLIAGSAPSANISLGEAANLTDTSTSWFTFNCC